MLRHAHWRDEHETNFPASQRRFFCNTSIILRHFDPRAHLGAWPIFPTAWNLGTAALSVHALSQDKAAQEGFILQRNVKEEPFGLPWSQFKCVYTLTSGFTYKACGLLFTPHPLSKQEQFIAAKICQHNILSPTLLHDGCLWVGIVGLPPELRSLLPEDICVMPPSACANTNSLFTKLI